MHQVLANKTIRYPVRHRDTGYLLLDGILDNFGIIFSVHHNAFILCVQPIQRVSENIYSTDCMVINNNIIPLFTELLSAPNYWMLNTHREFYKKHSNDIAKLAFTSNPFLRLEKHLVYQHLFQTVFRQANASLYISGNGPESKSKYGGVLILRKYDLPLYDVEILPDCFFGKIVPLKFLGYQFLTCSSDKSISFGFYFVPFKIEVWGSITASIIILVTALQFYYKYDITASFSFSPCLFVSAFMFEEAQAVPKRLERQIFFRLLISGWILMSNCYNGIMISELNSPLPPFNIPERFQDLICEDQHFLELRREDANLSNWVDTRVKLLLQYLTDLSKWMPLPVEQRARMLRPYINSDCYKILSPPSEEFMFQIFDLLYLTAISSSYHGHKLYLEELTILLLSNPKHAFIPKTFDFTNKKELMLRARESIEKEIVQCGKSAYVLQAADSGMTYEHLSKKYFKTKFYKSRDIIGLAPFGWAFEREGNSKVPIYFQSMFETGVHGRLETEIQNLEVHHHNYSAIISHNSAIGLDGAFITLFILCGTSLIIAMLVWILECRDICKAIVLESIRKLLSGLFASRGGILVDASTQLFVKKSGENMQKNNIIAVAAILLVILVTTISIWLISYPKHTPDDEEGLVPTTTTSTASPPTTPTMQLHDYRTNKEKVKGSFPRCPSN
ncbi:hypothetical protein Fcan01_18200 [Folsomia candida]|uniref:Uncharacterized protein n=1 Tax=Folsomia candida TaxID=158441 RepID=A0A226DN76_FOLCA|nr:hypothetical protein Fcan01_18200 [Folsomia candida]